ncbi:glutathione transferase FuA class [Trametes sanguinea]|nr:glutathione transferase FuA class [Trametes sanguinea]
MSHSVITLYDINSTIPEPWAPNIWRIRFILNYKRLPHRTVWVELNEVEPTLRMIGAPPVGQKPDGRAVYTLPVIVDTLRSKSHPVVLSNVCTIAEYLEATYPARPIFPEGSRAMQALFVHYIQEIFIKPLLPILIPLTHQRLPERTQAHLRRGGSVVGPPHAAMGGYQHEQAWVAVKEQFNFLASVLDKNNSDGNGVVAMGRDVSYADFALCSVLIWIERVSPHECWAQIREWNGGRWKRLRNRCHEYMDVY